MNLNDPNVRRTLAKLKWRYRDMKREGTLVLQGRKTFTNASATNVAKTWMRYDWLPPSHDRA